MPNLKNLVQQFLIALTLCTSGAALAGPAYHVRVDTSAYSGQGLMDFTFLANVGATPATAVIGNVSGAFGAGYDRSRGASGAFPGQLELINRDGGSYLSYWVTLGGILGFDVRFEGDFASIENVNGTQLNVTLYNEDFSDFVGIQGSFASFELQPKVNGMAGGVLVSQPNDLASVAMIPEPPTQLLLAGALMLMGLVRRHYPCVIRLASHNGADQHDDQRFERDGTAGTLRLLDKD